MKKTLRTPAWQKAFLAETLFSCSYIVLLFTALYFYPFYTPAQNIPTSPPPTATPPPSLTTIGCVGLANSDINPPIRASIFALALLAYFRQRLNKKLISPSFSSPLSTCLPLFLLIPVGYLALSPYYDASLSPLKANIRNYYILQTFPPLLGGYFLLTHMLERFYLWKKWKPNFALAKQPHPIRKMLILSLILPLMTLILIYILNIADDAFLKKINFLRHPDDKWGTNSTD